MNPRFSNQRNHALTRVEVLVIIVVLVVLAAILLPILAVSKKKSSRINCVGNVKEISLAYRVWAGDNNDKYPMGVSVTNGGSMEMVATGNVMQTFLVMSNELSTPKILICPADTRTAAPNFIRLNNQNLSYFMALDADESNPQKFLDGDRNIHGDTEPQNGILMLTPGDPVRWTSQMHGNMGNLGLSDGSVQQLTSSGLETMLRHSGESTNHWRISLP